MLNRPMKKSTKFLVGGTFCIVSLAVAGSVFSALGMDFGTTQMLGSTLAGLMGAARLVA